MAGLINLPSTPFFSCNFCSFKTKIQVDINAHYLFVHFFENPDCSVATPHEVENYMYSKDHFERCIFCNREQIISLMYPDRFAKKDRLNLRSMVNYFCGNCYDDYEKMSKEKAIEKDIEAAKYYKRKNDQWYLRKYNKMKRIIDGIWQYLQSVSPNRIRMYEKTLYRIHNMIRCKNCDKEFVPDKSKDTMCKLCKANPDRFSTLPIDPLDVDRNDTFVSNKYYGKERKEKVDELRYD